MITAHLPAGYLLTKGLSRNFSALQKPSILVCGLIASIFPDVDILWFYIKGGVLNHRYYLTHWPVFWLGVFIITFIILILAKKKHLLIYLAVIEANLMLHLILDALAGPVFYAAPFIWERIQLIKIPAVYDWWVWNFLRHWTFQLELIIWSTAALAFGLARHENKGYACKK